VPVIGRKEVAYATNRLVFKRGVTQNQRTGGVTQNQRTEKTIKVAADGPQQKEER